MDVVWAKEETEGAGLDGLFQLGGRGWKKDGGATIDEIYELTLSSHQAAFYFIFIFKRFATQNGSYQGISYKIVHVITCLLSKL